MLQELGADVVLKKMTPPREWRLQVSGLLLGSISRHRFSIFFERLQAAKSVLFCFFSGKVTAYPAK